MSETGSSELSKGLVRNADIVSVIDKLLGILEGNYSKVINEYNKGLVSEEERARVENYSEGARAAYGNLLILLEADLYKEVTPWSTTNA